MWDRIKSLVGARPESRPRFSLCHATARVPAGWQEAAKAWMGRADNPELIEYVICCDRADWDRMDWKDYIGFPTVPVINEGRQCAVDGWNTACAAATGDIIITVADDWFPPEHWDTLLWNLIAKNHGSTGNVGGQWAVWVATGVNDRLMTFSILTREYYQRYGYVFYPEYIGMYADNDFQKQCERDGVLIDARQILPVFEHRHPTAGTAAPDDIYARQNRSEAYDVGRKLFEARWPALERAAKEPLGPDVARKPHFNDVSEELTAPSQDRPRIAVCLPGETVSLKHWVRAWTQVVIFLVAKKNFILTPIYGHVSSVAVTRQGMANTVCALPDKHEFVLWIDDDQIVDAVHVERLLETMERYPDVDVVSGWAYIQDEQTGFTAISAGKYTDDGSSVMCIPIPEMYRLASQGIPVEVQWTGFPVVLMRYGVIEKAMESARARMEIIMKALGHDKPETRKLCFAPIFAENSAFGFTGEDVAFCVNTKDFGGKILVDSRVFVEHLKLRPIRPVTAVAEEQPKEVMGRTTLPPVSLKETRLAYTGI